MQAPALSPLVLAGRVVRLEPLCEAHVDALWEVGADPELWRWSASTVGSRDDMARWVGSALQEAAAGQALPFATCLARDGRVVGSTRFGAYAPEHRRIEIGWTFVGRPWQRTAVNTEAKLLMLGHAFEALGLARVELKTDRLNEASRRAILRLGAREEGLLRAHMLTATGRVRDTVYHSILREEWPAVRAALRQRLAGDPPA